MGGKLEEKKKHGQWLQSKNKEGLLEVGVKVHLLWLEDPRSRVSRGAARPHNSLYRGPEGCVNALHSALVSHLKCKTNKKTTKKTQTDSMGRFDEIYVHILFYCVMNLTAKQDYHGS